MTRKTGLDWQILTLAGVLVALTLVGVFTVIQLDDERAGYVTLPRRRSSRWRPFWSVTRPPQDQRRALLAIMVIALVMRVLLLPGTPVSTDIFRYVWDGRVQAAGINPYLHIPAAAALPAPARCGDLSGDQSRQLCADDLSADVADRFLPGHAHLRVRWSS